LKALLVIDCGNSNTKLALFRGEKLVRRMSRPSEGDIDDWVSCLVETFRNWRFVRRDLTGCALSSVHSHMGGVILASLARMGIVPLLPIEAGCYPAPVYYQPTESLGADRLCDAMGGWRRTRGKCIVVDFGTAITFNAVGQEGEFLGGAITPSPPIAYRALYENTALPHKVILRFPEKVVCQDTLSSIASGLTIGWSAMIERLVELMKIELGEDTPALATGGGYEAFAGRLTQIQFYYPDLTLEGAAAIFRSYTEGCK